MWTDLLEPLIRFARLVFWLMVLALAVSVPLAIWKVVDLVGG